jgi:hypothetical protein
LTRSKTAVSSISSKINVGIKTLFFFIHIYK